MATKSDELWSEDHHQEFVKTMLEKDPDGIGQHEPGAKVDEGKNRLDLVLGDFVRALEAVGWIGTGGAVKYTDHGWLSVRDGVRRYSDAMLRHWAADHRGELYDQQSGQLHKAHMAWNALAILELQLRELENERT